LFAGGSKRSRLEASLVAHKVKTLLHAVPLPQRSPAMQRAVRNRGSTRSWRPAPYPWKEYDAIKRLWAGHGDLRPNCRSCALREMNVHFEAGSGRSAFEAAWRRADGGLKV
jgi:hypothetical protein